MGLPFLDVLEHMASMKDFWCNQMSRSIDRHPIKVGSQSMSRVARNRYYWPNFPVDVGPGGCSVTRVPGEVFEEIVLHCVPLEFLVDVTKRQLHFAAVGDHHSYSYLGN